MESLSDISDLIIKSKQDEKTVTFKKQLEPGGFPTLDLKEPIGPPKLIRENASSNYDEGDIKLNDLKFEDPSDDDNVDGKDANNILFISDTDKPNDLKLEMFQHTIEFKKDLFQNRTIKQIFDSGKFIWLNLRDSEGRSWLSKNIKNTPYNVSLIYTSKNAQWVNQISIIVPKAVKLSLKKLKKVDGFNEAEVIKDVMSNIVSLSKPSMKVINVLKNCFSCSKK